MNDNDTKIELKAAVITWLLHVIPNGQYKRQDIERFRKKLKIVHSKRITKSR